MPRTGRRSVLRMKLDRYVRAMELRALSEFLLVVQFGCISHDEENC